MKRNIILATLAILWIGGIIFLATTTDKPIAEEVSAESAQDTDPTTETIPEEEEEYVILDVRTQEEYDIVHVEGATLIPHTEIATRVETEIPNKNAFIAVYCQSGTRSATVTKQLTALGYQNVVDVGAITSITDKVKVWKE